MTYQPPPGYPPFPPYALPAPGPAPVAPYAPPPPAMPPGFPPAAPQYAPPPGPPPAQYAATQPQAYQTDPMAYFGDMASVGVGSVREPNFPPGEFECVAEDYTFFDDQFGPRVIIISRIQEVIEGAPTVVGSRRRWSRDLRPQTQDPSKRLGAAKMAQKDLNTFFAHVLSVPFEELSPHVGKICGTLARSPLAFVGARYRVRATDSGTKNKKGEANMNLAFSPSRHGANVTIQSLLSGQAPAMTPAPVPPPAAVQTSPIPAVAQASAFAPAGDQRPRWDGAGWVLFGDPRWGTLPPMPA